MVNPSSQEHVDRLLVLEAKVQALAAPYEDALSHRVALSAEVIIKQKFQVFLLIGASALGVIGWIGFAELQQQTNASVQAALENTVDSKIENLVRNSTPLIEAKVKEASGRLIDHLEKEVAVVAKQGRDGVQEAIREEAALMAFALDRALADETEKMQAAVAAQLRRVAEQLAASTNNPSLVEALTKKPPPQTINGFAYYGIRDRDNAWHEQNFFVEGKDKAAMPVRGDIIVAMNPVNVREGLIEVVGSRWVNKPVNGFIKKDRKLVVDDVQGVGGGSYIWVKVGDQR